MNLEQLQQQCLSFLGKSTPADAAHDLSHVKRVVKNCLYLTDTEGANELVTMPAAWLHDCVAVAKDSPERALVEADNYEDLNSLLHGERPHFESRKIKRSSRTA